MHATSMTMAALSVSALTACGAGAPPRAEPPPTSVTSSTTTTTVSTSTRAEPVAPPPRTITWVDLEVGDCLVDLPDVDLGAVTVTVVDCAAAHRAEVYLLAPIAVNAAIADVANRQCTAGLSPYAGDGAAGNYSVTYLIDSRQDRTTDNPNPSTVICLLDAADGSPLVGSARRRA